MSYAGVIGLEPQGAFLSGWKGLGRFWIISLGLLFSAVLAIATIGPREGQPERPPVVAMLTKPIPPAEPKPVLHPAPVAVPVLPPAPPVGRDPTPKVAVLVSGMGMSAADTSAAIETLPAGISLAMSPYATDAAKLLPDIRAHGHEALVAVPMEPEGNPLNDPDGSTALMTSLTETENMARLRAVLAKAEGAVGATNVMGPLRGERLMNETDMFAGVVREIAGRGMFFVDTGSHPPLPRDRSADIVLDDPPLDASTLDERLERLTTLARERGMALGVVGVPRPLVLERLATWSQTLEMKGIVLVPVSALIGRAPVVQAAATTQETEH